MKYYIYHWRGDTLSIPGVWQEGEPEHPREAKPHWIEIPEGKFEEKIKELTKKHDIMLVTVRGETHIYVDDKGKRFRQM